MTKERVIHPPIRQSFDAMGHVALTDQIGSSMERFRDEEGVLYDHSTHMGTEAAREIARYCERVHRPGVAYEEVWGAAKDRAIKDTLEYCEYYLENLATNPTDYKAAAHARKTIESRKFLQLAIRSALLMYAIERQDATYQASQRNRIDELFMSRAWPIIDEITMLREEAEKTGLVVCDESKSYVTSVTGIIDGRQREIEQSSYFDTLYSIKDRIEIGQISERLSWDAVSLRYAEHISTEQYDVLLERILLNAQTCNAELAPFVLTKSLEVFPQNYLHDLYERDDTIAVHFRNLLEQLSVGYSGYASRRELYLHPLHAYFPGGITGDAAKSHPLVGPIVKAKKTDSAALIDTLPVQAGYNTQDRKPMPREIDSFNREVRVVIRDTCISLFGDEDGLHYAKDLIRSFEPRKFVNEELSIYDISKIDMCLRRVESFTRKWGADTMMKLYERFDIAAIDMISHDDIKKLKGLLENDPEVVERLRRQDITLIAFDAYGSHNEAMYNTVTMLTTKSSDRSRIVVPWKDPSDFYRMLALLKNRAIKFSTLVISAHGFPGAFTVNKDDERLILLSQTLPSQTSFSDRASAESTQVSLSSSSLRRIAKDYMEESKHGPYDSELTPDGVVRYQAKKKRIVFATCYGDVGIDGIIPSVAESTIRTLRDTNAIVIAGENMTAVSQDRDNSRGLNIYGPPRGEEWDDAKAHLYTSNLVTLKSDPVTWTTVRTPYRKGIVA